MDKITNIDYRVLCYMKKLNSCFIDEIASKFGQAGLASIDNLDDLWTSSPSYFSRQVSINTMLSVFPITTFLPT
jgi:hypothetical protein